MRVMLLGCAAALAALSVPAGAQSFTGPDFAAGHGVTVHGGGSHDDFRSDFRGDDRRDRRRNRGDVFLYPPDYQGDSAWRSDSFNDWWHDRPSRSIPRWVFTNQDCARRYWQGGGWRC